MSWIWNEKTNFILLHSIILHQQQSTINWSSIVQDIQLEILSTPQLLKVQYEFLLENFHSKEDSTSLYIAIKQIYLHSLCQKVEDGLQTTIEIVYEFIRHVRSKRLHIQDIEQLMKEWNFNSSSDKEQKNKERLFKILNRLRDYMQTLPNNDHQSKLIIHSNTNESISVEKIIQNEQLETVSDSNDEPLIEHKRNDVLHLPNREKSLFTRRRTRSLTIMAENQDDKVNIGVEWFVPKFKRQQRSSSLHAQCSSIPSISSSTLPKQHLESNGTLLTTIDNDDSSDSTNNSNVRRTHTQPSVSWLPLTNEQIAEKECQQTNLKLLDDQQLDDVSSTDSDSIEVQWSSSRKTKISSSSISHSTDEHHQDNNSCKRQRLT
ncbi:hypothetical protein I4U23_010326 [Adineta vaga]|nr:hypothetical protein I4U23_010326 [Adineta vaga]